ncbi:Mycobacterium rhizamassiliense ORFan, partial [Mycobacterium rhizamassiliense]|jgi:hypothetical protein
VIVSGIVLAVIGCMSGLTVLKAIGGILIVVMWGRSRVFWPTAAPGFEVADAEFDAGRQVARASRPPRHLRRIHRHRSAESPAASVRAA